MAKMNDKPLSSDAEDRAMLQRAKLRIWCEAKAAAAQLEALNAKASQTAQPAKITHHRAG